MKYRLFRKDDVATVHRLGKREFGSQSEYSWDWSLKSVHEYLRPKHGFGIVCVDDEKIIGFVLVQKEYSSQKPNVSWATYVYVIEAYRRQNIGSRLLDLAAKRLKSTGKTDLIADIYADNTGSIKFFTKRKFRVAEKWLLLQRKL